MAINFPNSPSTNDTHSHNGLTYIYDGTIWKLQTLDTTTSNEIIPYAYAHVRANTAGTGTNMSWGAYNSGNGDMAFTFDTALSDNLYYVLAEREQYDTHTVSIISKSTTGFTARWLDNSGTGPLSPDMFPGVLIVYASDPTKSIGGVGGGGDRDRIIESDTSVECIDDGTGDRIVFKTAATEAVQIDANRQILISGTQSGNNVAKIYNDTDGLGTGVLGIYASSNNATPRDVRFYSGGGTANEIFRIGKDGQIGVGGDVGTAGEVLTSGGPSGAATWSAASGGSGSSTFVGLTDTPNTFTADKFVKVNSGGSALEWTDAPTSGIPVVNVADFGALPGASGAANRTGIEAAINSLATTGGMVYIPTGTYDITGTILIDQGVMGDGGGVSIIGPTQNYRITAADTEGVCLRSTDAGSDIIKVNNVRNVTFANLSFDHKVGTPRNGGNAVHFYSNVNTQQIRMDRIYIRNQFGAIKVDGHSISTFRDIEIRDIANEGGSYGMLFSASAGGSERQDQIRCENVLIDGVVSGEPHPTANGLWVKDFVNSIWFLNCASNRCNKGFLMDSTVPSGDTGNPGSFFRINDCDFDTNLDVGIEIAGGSFIWINNPYISSNKKNGLRTTSTFTGVLRINDADCRGNWEHGILIGSDMHKKIFITNPQVCYNSANSNGTYDGIHIVDSGSLNQSDITIMGGQCGGSDMMGTTDGSNTTNSTPQNWGIKFSNNSKYDRISISNIDCSNNRAGGVYFSYNKGQHNYIHNVIGVHAGNQGH